MTGAHKGPRPYSGKNNVNRINFGFGGDFVKSAKVWYNVNMQQKQITIQNSTIPYILKTSKKARRMRMTVYCGGSVVITKPVRFGDNLVEKFIVEKADWVLSKINYFKQFSAEVLGDNRKEYLENKNKALNFVQGRIDFINRDGVFEFNRISIKNQKSRWGSCSRKGNLNFNYRILFLPERIADYIVAHELCHLKEFNHSKKFWSAVEQIIPDYKVIRKELKRLKKD